MNDLLEEYELVDKQLWALSNKIKELGKQNKWEEADKINEEELKPLLNKWIECRNRWLKSMIKKN